MQPLDPLKLNLQGQILIEASAGTGKTYTIELLFLRLLLERGLSVDEILVVTFTRAATEELRGRVRQRIRDGLDMLEGQGPDDENLQQLVKKIEDQDRAVILLSDALTRMDEAAIFTIHGFCQRMLQEHAFESGAAFEMEFLETEQLLRGRIIEDFWRLRFYNSSKEEAAWAASLWTSPHDLLTGLGGHLTRPDVECVPEINDDELVRQMAELLPRFTEVQTMWQECGQEVADLLRENKRLLRNNSTTYGLNRLEMAMEVLDRFLSGTKMGWLIHPKTLELFTSSKIHDSLKKNKHDPPEHPFFDRFEHFFQAHREMTEYRRFGVLLAARSYLITELDRRKEEQAQLYFDDLLTHLDASLQSRGGRQLAQNISKRFPVIMVDEFQDTDPLQYRIFAAIHAEKVQMIKRSNDQPHQSTKKSEPGLFLIGDPKQAIYGFRGADIFTYIRARQDTAPENQFTMDANYRSTTTMVAAVNQLFDREASFLFDKDEIDFKPVKAAGQADSKPLLLDGNPLPALTCLQLPEGAQGKPLGKEKARDSAARFCAHEIADLLAAGLSGTAKIDDQPLSGADIAVLVRTHAEAELVRKELSALSITSVYYSQDSVFTSHEASQLVVVLTCLLDLSDGACVRTGLATDLFGYNAIQLDQLRSDEQQWEEVMASMNRYHRIWQQQGFTPMFQQLLAEQKVVRRLHGAINGERMLTNFLHLAELLQEAAQHQVGAEGLLRWLSDQIQAPEERADRQQLRLESDENLVKIVTIHKSKGLQYPIIFLPFLWSARPCNSKELLAFHHPDDPNQLLIDLGTGNEEHYRLAERERLAGDLRLLYVAITRARYSCFFCWGRIIRMNESGLSYLLHGTGIPEAETLAADLDTLQTTESRLVVKPFPTVFSVPTLQNSDDMTPLTVARFKGYIDSSWQITSYSRLTAHSDPQPERPDYDNDNRGQTPIILPGQPAYRNNIEVNNWGLSPIITIVIGHDVFAFPRGAAAGTCLHAILELISFTDPAGHEQIIRAQLARAGFDDTILCRD
jgi:exodeoxyribonuclease V beta subunit